MVPGGLVMLSGRNVPAFSGIVFATAQALVFLSLEKSPTGPEHVKETLVGAIYTVAPNHILKTAVLYYLRGRRPTARRLPDLAASFEQAVVEVLVTKTIRAITMTKAKTLLLGGGVSANQRLRIQLNATVKKLPGLTSCQPNLAYATDNAAMIALAGALHAKTDALTRVTADATWELVS